MSYPLGGGDRGPGWGIGVGTADHHLLPLGQGEEGHGEGEGWPPRPG